MTSEQEAWRTYRTRLASARKAVEEARGAWALWADDVRAEREPVVGVPSASSDGPDLTRMLQDPVYRAALELGDPLAAARAALKRAAEAVDEWDRREETAPDNT